MKLIRKGIAALCLLLVSCQGPRYTAFAPLDVRLEPVPGGGARYLVVVNTSDRDLHNVSCSVYIWNDWNATWRRRSTHYSYISAAGIGAGQSVRSHGWGTTEQEPIVEVISGVELVGHSDEGYFRQAWTYTDSDQLRPVVVKSGLGRE